MEERELINNTFVTILSLPKNENSDDKFLTARLSFLSSLEDSIMGYSLSEVELSEFSKDNLLSVITDFNTGELLYPYYKDMELKNLNETDYIYELLGKVQDLVNWFFKGSHLQFNDILTHYNIRDIESSWYGDVVIIKLRGEKIA